MSLFKKKLIKHSFEVKTALAVLEIEVIIDPEKLEQDITKEIISKNSELIDLFTGERNRYLPPELICDRIASLIGPEFRRNIKLIIGFKKAAK
ncbi:MAG: hypothetical protein PHS16_02020 [Candidatus Colwellbacteria bacterium]|jgi:hypothetical protein|nr:hypothetical protein [Candidatus Colwellbacteria bacterium]MDD3752693.1 hypothetical protein [Candidatus Colwellbacteria bacterium]MDD4818842.1 hypothetical protein [Candidatus Colwellbacteria bacterium]